MQVPNQRECELAKLSGTYHELLCLLANEHLCLTDVGLVTPFMETGERISDISLKAGSYPQSKGVDNIQQMKQINSQSNKTQVSNRGCLRRQKQMSFTTESNGRGSAKEKKMRERQKVESQNLMTYRILKVKMKICVGIFAGSEFRRQFMYSAYCLLTHPQPLIVAVINCHKPDCLKQQKPINHSLK